MQQVVRRGRPTTTMNPNSLQTATVTGRDLVVSLAEIPYPCLAGSGCVVPGLMRLRRLKTADPDPRCVGTDQLADYA
jgi:hypothetical protein